MASTSSVGAASLASASSAAAFYTRFTQATDALRTHIGDAADTAALHAALQRLAALNAELTAAVDSGVLPAHDQALHRRALDEITATLDQRRRAIQPAKTVGAGFAFRRKPAKPTPSAPQPTITATEPTSTTSAEDTADADRLVITSLSDTSYIPPPQQEAVRLSIHVCGVTNSLVDLRSLNASVVSVQLRDISDSILLLPCIEGSVMAHDIVHSLVGIPSCHQFRMHTSTRVAVQLATKRSSIVTIEACRNLVFVADPHALKVQDFDDLIGSHQLASSTPHVAAASCNFRTVQASISIDAPGATQTVADRIDEALTTLGG